MDEKYLEIAEQAQSAAVDEQVRFIRSKLKQPPKDFKGLCIRCEATIPKARVKLNCTTCVDCQERLDLLEKQRGR